MNNTIKNILVKGMLVLSFALLAPQLYSQKKVFHGYYITKGGDSVTGVFPGYTQWNKNPHKVEFMPSAASPAIELTPENTKKLYIENYDTYLSFKGERMINPIDFEQALAEKDTFGFRDQFVPISTFLRLVARTGNFELFVLNDRTRTNYYYRLNNEPLQELKFKMYWEANAIREVHEYRQQLSNLFLKEITRRNISVDLEKVKYTEESISGLLEKLTPLEKRRTKTRNPAQGLIVAAGVSSNFLSVKGEKEIRQTGITYGTSLTPLLSIGYMSPLNRSFGRFFIFPQLKLYNYKNEGEKSNGIFTNITTFKTSLVVAPVINVGGNIINRESYKYFIAGGAGMSGLLKNIQQEKRKVTSDQSLYQSSETELSTLTYNVNLSTGFMLRNKVVVTAIYNVPVPTANFINYTPYHSSVQFTVGYKL